MVTTGLMLILFQVKLTTWFTPTHDFLLRLRSVSCGFMIACAACAYFIVYSVFLICRMPDFDEDEIETQSAGEVARKSSTTDNKKEIEFSSAL